MPVRVGRLGGARHLAVEDGDAAQDSVLGPVADDVRDAVRVDVVVQVVRVVEEGRPGRELDEAR